MAFKEISTAKLATMKEAAMLGGGLLQQEFNLGEDVTVEQLVELIPEYLEKVSGDPEFDPDDPIVRSLMGYLYGYAFAWECDFRWALPDRRSFHKDPVVISRDGRFWISPFKVVNAFLTKKKRSPLLLFRMIMDGKFPEYSGDSPVELS